MRQVPELIVMLTHNDRTWENAYDVFEECKQSEVKFWGIKEEGLPLAQMKDLFAYMKKWNKTTILEVVSYDETSCLAGAEMAAACGCDILMGTCFFDSVNGFCKEHHLKYMPFVGKVSGRPSVLEGTPEDMLREAQRYLEKGVYGIDLLGYRYTGDAVTLNKTLVSQIHAPVCLAGSVNSYERLNEVKESGARFFTIGGAFFENKFDGTHRQQIDKVCAYMKK